MILLLIAGVFSAVFILSSNVNFMKIWAQYRYSGASKLPSDKYRFGDLYGFSYLAQYKKREFIADDVKPYYLRNKLTRNVDLYSICDSYLWAFNPIDSLMHNTNSFNFTRWGYDAKKFHLNPSKKNVLLLEIVERNALGAFSDTAYVYRHLGVVSSVSEETVTDMFPSVGWAKNIFNKNIDTNLEFNLFEYPIFTPFKELKAQLNYSVFNRQSSDVIVSKIRNQLYYGPTVTATEKSSSFRPITDGKIDTLVTSLNQIYQHYRKAGFSEVYLVIMPNPVTILEPELGVYNDFLPRTQYNKILKIPVIDIYSKFNKIKSQPIYQISDSHWAKLGFLTGIAKIDSAIATH